MYGNVNSAVRIAGVLRLINAKPASLLGKSSTNIFGHCTTTFQHLTICDLFNRIAQDAAEEVVSL